MTQPPPSFRIIPARTTAEIDVFRSLCREYAASLPFSLDYQGFDAEMAELPGKYTPPKGELFIALDAEGRGGGNRGLGIVAVRELPSSPEWPRRPGVAELKRMYVRPDARGRGIGRALARAAVTFAKAVDYREIWLDSEPDFAAALATYRGLGFVDIPRYNDDPNQQTVYMGLMLASTAAERRADESGAKANPGD